MNIQDDKKRIEKWEKKRKIPLILIILHFFAYILPCKREEGRKENRKRQPKMMINRRRQNKRYREISPKKTNTKILKRKK